MTQAIKDKIEREAKVQALEMYEVTGLGHYDQNLIRRQKCEKTYIDAATKWAEIALKLREALEHSRNRINNAVPKDYVVRAIDEALAQFDKEVSE